jgi:hypothetical protein
MTFYCLLLHTLNVAVRNKINCYGFPAPGTKPDKIIARVITYFVVHIAILTNFCAIRNKLLLKRGRVVLMDKAVL